MTFNFYGTVEPQTCPYQTMSAKFAIFAELSLLVCTESLYNLATLLNFKNLLSSSL